MQLSPFKYLSRLSKHKTIILVVIIGLLISFRLYLPTAIKNYVNKTLDTIPEYDGRIGDVTLHLWRGAYTIHDLKLVKTTGKVPVPLVDIKDASFSIEWKALFQGKIVGKVNIINGKLNFVNSPAKNDSQIKIDDEWLKAVKDLFPLRLNRFNLTHCEIHYKDFDSDPKVDIKLTEVYVEGKDFSNTRSPKEQLESTIQASAKAESVAPVKLFVKLQPSAKIPTFGLNFSLEKLPIVKVNDFLKAYGGFDAEGGDISIYSELVSEKSGFKGYVKPLIKDIEIFKLKNVTGNPLKFIWEGLVGLTAEILENHKYGQIGSTIEISGTFDKPETSTWDTILGVLKNAFIKGLKPGVDDSLNINKEVKYH